MINLIPLAFSLFSNWQRILIYTLVAVTVGIAIWGHGYHKGSVRLFEYQAEQAKLGAAIVVKQGQVTERIVTRYIKVKGETERVTVTVEKEVERYASHNLGSCLDGGFRRLHDAAALNAVPESASSVDGESGAPQAAAVLQTVTQNYSACHRTADKLDALQEWVKAQYESSQN